MWHRPRCLCLFYPQSVPFYARYRHNQHNSLKIGRKLSCSRQSTSLPSPFPPSHGPNHDPKKPWSCPKSGKSVKIRHIQYPCAPDSGQKRDEDPAKACCNTRQTYSCLAVSSPSQRGRRKSRGASSSVTGNTPETLVMLRPAGEVCSGT